MELRDQIVDALRGHDADYVEIRVEEGRATRIAYRGRDLDDFGISRGIGGNVRALVRGGWGFVSFNDLAGLRARVALAVRQARVAAQSESHLAAVEPVADVVPARTARDPDGIPLADKKQLLDEYNEVIWSTPHIQTSSISYGDSHRRFILATSDGTYVEQQKVDLAARLSAVARRNGEVQQSGLSLGSNGDFGLIEGIHDRVRQIAERAVRLLDARPAKGGEYTVICDPVLTGVFAHEAFGHLSEADHLYENDRMRELMLLGKRFGRPHLSISDDPTLPGLRGSYQYDDEGVPARKNPLIHDGVLVGRLHSRETAGKMGEPTTGNARAINYRFPPIVRMTNTFIEPGTATLADMLAGVREGIYAKEWYGGQTSMEMFTFSAGEAYLIRNGEIAEMLRGVVLTGNLFETLDNIDMVGSDLQFNQGGGCGKGGQYPLPVATGGPHIRIQRCVVGGR
ncbi:MAG: TldD/PmbA family protein [Chloroflexi bacterium]|nr:TldD/PmbA family protein [Chloroflexota bacterium]